MDKDLDELRDEIIEVTRALRDLTGATRDYSRLQREVKDDADAFANNTKKVDDNTRAQAALNQQYRDNGSILDQYGKVLVDGTKKTEDANKATKAKAEADREAADAARRFKSSLIEDLGRALETVAQAALQTALNLQRGAKGLTAYDSQIQQLASSAKGVIGNLSRLGPIAGAFGKALNLGTDAVTGLAMAATDMGQRLYEGFGALNRSGGAAADGLTGLFEDAKNLGLGMNELNALTEAVGARSQDFALFGGTVFEARKRLGQMGDSMRESREQFLSLGMTMPDVVEGMSNYLALQGRMGRTQNRTTEELAASTRKYLLEQDALTKLLGVTRQQQEEAQQRALMNEQFLAKVRQLELSGQGDVAKELLKMSKMYAAFGPESEAAFHGIVTGNLAAEASVKGFVASQGEMLRSTQAVINRQMSATEAVQKTGQAMGRYQDTVGVFTGQMRTNNEIAVNLAEQQRARILSDQNLTEQEKKIQLEQIAMGAEAARAQDPLLAAQAKLYNTQIAANEALDNMAFDALPIVQDALQDVTDAALAAAESLGKLTDSGERDDAAIQENTQALLDLAPELGKARAEYAKQFRDASVTQKMGFGRTPEQRQAAAELDRVERLEENLKLNRELARKRSPARTGGLATEGFFGPEPIEAPEPEPPASGAGIPPRGSNFTERDLRRMGLKIKSGYAQEPGNFIQNNTIELAQEAQRMAGFQRITGFNDAYHQGTNSLHTEGRAFDFTLKNRPSPEEGAEIIAQLMGKGASKVLDEYNRPSRRAVGPGHIHVELPAMARGGITEGPSIVGEAGPEAVVPLPDGKAIPVEIPAIGQDALASSIDSLSQSIREMSGPSQVGVKGKTSQAGTAVPGYIYDPSVNTGTAQTDLKAIKDIVGSLATFDKSTSAISDLQSLQRILQGGIGSNVNAAGVDLGMPLRGSELGNDIGERIKEIMATKDTDLKTALKEVTTEFKTTVSQMLDTMKTQQNAALQVEMLEVLNAINRSQTRTADASQRLAQVATN